MKHAGDVVKKWGPLGICYISVKNLSVTVSAAILVVVRLVTLLKLVAVIIVV